MEHKETCLRHYFGHVFQAHPLPCGVFLTNMYSSNTFKKEKDEKNAA